MTKSDIALVLFVVAALCLLGAWLIATNGEVFGGDNFNAYMAAGGFLTVIGFAVERVR